jgi:hypothetical protein
MNKNLVLGMCFKYTKKDVFYFVESFLEKCSGSDLILVTDNFTDIELTNYLNDNCIKTYKASTLSYIFCKVEHSRYLIYQDLFYNLNLNYENVFLTDVRDVVFLKNIFNFSNPLEKMQCFLESKTYNLSSKFSSNFNFLSYEKCFGIEAACNMINKYVSCAGTVLSNQNDMKKYISLMTKLLDDNNGFRYCQDALDQAIHNFLTYKKLSCNINPNGVGVATLQETDPDNIIIKNSEIYVHGSAPYVLHQYDRHPELYNFVKNLYPYE